MAPRSTPLRDAGPSDPIALETRLTGRAPRRSPARTLARTALAALLVAVLGLPALHPAAAEPMTSVAAGGSTTGSVSGVVTDGDGAPLADLLVYLMGADGASFSYTSSDNTGTDGSYRIDDVAPGTYSIQFFGDSAHVGEWWDDRVGRSDAQTFEIGAGEHLGSMDAALSEGASISGIVTDPDGARLPDATVRVYGMRSGTWGWLKSTTTDASGAYRFGVLGAGIHAVHVLPPAGTGMVDEWWDDSAFERTSTRFEVARDEVVSGIDVELPRAATITGVVSGADGAPLHDVSVRAWTTSTAQGDGVAHYARTDEHGVYVMEGLKAARYQMRFTPPATSEHLPEESGEFAVAAGAVVRQNASLVAGASIAGRVTGREGTPLASARVTLTPANGPSETVSTAADGTYRFAQLPAGSYTLHFDNAATGLMLFDGSDYFAEWWRDAPERDQRTFFDLATGQHLTGMDAELTPESNITGTITSDDGGGLPGHVSLYEIRDGEPHYVKYAYVDTDGRYGFGDVRAGTYTLEFTAADHLPVWWGDRSDATSAETFEVGTGEIVGEMDVQLSRGGSIAGTVTATDGAPLPSVIVNIYTAEGDGWKYLTNQLTDASGRYSRSGLLEGTYTVEFAKPSNYQSEWWNDHPSADAAEPIVLRAGEAATGIDATLGVAPTTLSSPTITGHPWIGHPVAASASSGTSSATLSYEWLADGDPIAGATQKILALEAAQSGKRITVRVTASSPGRPSTTKVSAATAPVIAPPVSSSTPTIVGSAVIGSTLTAAPGTWSSGTTLTYRWFANGMPVGGGTTSTLVLGSAQAGTRITVRVTGVKSGHTTVSRTSAPTAEVVRVDVSGLSPTHSTEPNPVRG
ncbi:MULTISPECIES: carboxypeptidase regulatory-like domain-containing protein [unclassified Agromyces]|uniref:carboxypeptidase regulatory-like domain-containing protein n=1 Tax=unclassified Agromyces TaxID=2639701 RepID=UPI0030150327